VQIAHRPLEPVDLEALLELNRLRARGGSGPRLQDLEDQFARDYSAHEHLAVYGTLAPGRPNHHQISDLAGEWLTGYSVTGELIDSGWAADLGYPALRWAPDGGAVPTHLFVSRQLPEHWARLDDFEGGDYLRILVPVHSGDSRVAVANLYAERRWLEAQND
jgi:gamma-glutamylcyclotransferase (GGCT)/AIG2-like uncharacterized protein YtfP